MVGTGIPLTNMIKKLYEGLDSKITMYLYNDNLEITGSLDERVLANKLSITDKFPHIAQMNNKPTSLYFQSVGEGEYLLAPISLINCHMALFREYTVSDFLKNATIPIFVSIVIILVIVMLALAIMNIGSL